MKKFLKAALVLGMIGFVVYKVYKYITKEPAYDEFEDLEDEFDPEDLTEEEVLAQKIKAAAATAVE